MATYTICDLCGSQENVSNTTCLTHSYKTVKGGLANLVSNNIYEGVREIRLDMCDSCKEKIANFVESLKPDEGKPVYSRTIKAEDIPSNISKKTFEINISDGIIAL